MKERLHEIAFVIDTLPGVLDEEILVDDLRRGFACAPGAGLLERIGPRYQAQTGKALRLFACRPSAGAGESSETLKV